LTFITAKDCKGKDAMLRKEETNIGYYVVGENLTPFYGTDWYNYNLTISNQKQDAFE